MFTGPNGWLTNMRSGDSMELHGFLIPMHLAIHECSGKLLENCPIHCKARATWRVALRARRVSHQPLQHHRTAPLRNLLGQRLTSELLPVSVHSLSPPPQMLVQTLDWSVLVLARLSVHGQTSKMFCHSPSWRVIWRGNWRKGGEWRELQRTVLVKIHYKIHVFEIICSLYT